MERAVDVDDQRARVGQTVPAKTSHVVAADGLLFGILQKGKDRERKGAAIFQDDLNLAHR